MNLNPFKSFEKPKVAVADPEQFSESEIVAEKILEQFDGLGGSIVELGEHLKNLSEASWNKIKAIPKIGIILPMVLLLTMQETSAGNPGPGGGGGSSQQKAKTEQSQNNTKQQRTPQQQMQRQQNIGNGKRVAINLARVIVSQTPNQTDDRVIQVIDQIDNEIRGGYYGGGAISNTSRSVSGY